MWTILPSRGKKPIKIRKSFMTNLLLVQAEKLAGFAGPVKKNNVKKE